MQSNNTVTIGVWHETERDITHCPSYYAADHETLRTIPGDYPVRLTFEGGYVKPMPYWLLIGLDAIRIDGALYSGFGGVNFASTELRKGERLTHTLQLHEYHLRALVESGRVTLYPEHAWTLDEKYTFQSPRTPKTWDEVRAMQSRPVSA